MKANMVLLAVLAPILCLYGCGKDKAVQNAQNYAVQAWKSDFVSIPDEINVFGTLAWDKKVEVTSPQDSLVQRLLVREGDYVQKGQKLAELYNQQVVIAVERAKDGVERAKSALTLAEAHLREGILSAESRLMSLEKSKLELEQAEREYEENLRKHQDQEKLFAAGGVTEEAIRNSKFALDSAKERLALMKMDIEIRSIGTRPEDLAGAGLAVPSDPKKLRAAIIDLNTISLRAERDAALVGVRSAESELRSAQLVLSELTIYAAISGIIGAKHIETGERVKRDDKLYTIIDMSVLHAQVMVAEAEAVRLQVGMQAKLSIEVLKVETEGIIDLISPIADSRNASFTVRIRISKQIKQLKPGMFVRTTIVLGPERRQIAVPDSVLFNRSSNAAEVFVIRAGRLELVPVRCGETMRAELLKPVPSNVKPGMNFVLVTEGLKQNDIVVNYPSSGLKEGDNVTVKQAQ